MDRKKEYLNLLSKNYDEAVQFLLEKYGPAEDDYFRKNSYERFLNDEIKNITKGNYIRTSEGLYCHHIDENKYENLSNKIYIKHYRYPFNLQKKDRLVYCDLFEHAILHILIAKETSLNFGIAGYQTKIAPMIKEWYLDEKFPKPKWMQYCYDKAYLKPEEASELLNKMNNIISKEADNIREEEKRIQKEKDIKILKIIKDLGYKNLNSNSSRSEIIHAMYILKENEANGYNNQYKDLLYSQEDGMKIMKPVEFEVFEKRMEPYDLEGILKNIELFISYKEGKIKEYKYISDSNMNCITKKEAKAKRKADKEREELERKKEQIEKKKEEEFYIKYPAFKKAGVKYDLTRQEVNVLLFKYYNEFSCFIKFQGAMKEYNRDELLDKLYSFIKK